MKRILAAIAITATAVMAFAAPAGANNVTGITATCHDVTITYDHFPTHPVTLTVNGTTTATTGEHGTVTVPIETPSHVSVTWTVDGEHHEFTDDFHLTCEQPPPPTTVPPVVTTTTPPPPIVTTTTAPPVLPGGNDEGPTLPKTGAGTDILLVIGGVFLGAGIALTYLARRS